MNNKLIMNETFKKIMITFLRVENESQLSYPEFDTIIPVESNKTYLQKPVFISGVGRIYDESDSRNGEIVAFCGYTSNEITSEIFVSSRCVIEIPPTQDYSAFSLLGYITQFIGIINKIEGRIGDRVLVLADCLEKKIIEVLFSKFGFNVVTQDYLKGDKLDQIVNDVSKLDFGIINSTKIDEFYLLKNYFNKESKVVFYNNDGEINLDIVPSNIIIEPTLGKGFFDKKYMMSFVNYPNSYVKYNVEFNLSLATQFINENIEILKTAINEQKINKLDDFTKQSNNINFKDKFIVFNLGNEMPIIEDNKTSDILDVVSSLNDKALNDFQYSLTNRFNPALIEFTLDRDNYSFKDAISFSERVVNSRCKKVVSKTTNIHTSVYKYYLADGSLVVINLISSKTIKDYSIEAHFDGTTLLLKNNKISAI